MRITWASTESIIAAAPPAKANNSKKPQFIKSMSSTGKRSLTLRKAEDKSVKRFRPIQREAKIQTAALSAKKQGKQKKVEHVKSKQLTFTFVYVGNLQAGITPARLESIFGKYGSIIRIQIRCSGGQAITVGVAIPSAVKGPRDRQYATVEFREHVSARRALELNGRNLDGMPLVVTVSPADLPEMKDIVDSRMKQIRSRLLDPQPQVPRPLRAQPTERFIDNSAPGADKHRILGFSFAATVV